MLLFQLSPLLYAICQRIMKKPGHKNVKTIVHNQPFLFRGHNVAHDSAQQDNIIDDKRATSIHNELGDDADLTVSRVPRQRLTTITTEVEDGFHSHRPFCD